MKIAFIIQDLCGEGAEYATAILVRGFIEKGYEVDLILSQIHNNRVQKGEVPFSIPNSVNVIMLPDKKARNNISTIRQYLRMRQADIIITMSANYEIATALASFGIIKRPKLYTVEHGIRFALNQNCEYAPIPKYWSRERIKRRLIYSCYDGILAVSNGVGRELCRMYGVNKQKIHIVYNPVIDEEFYKKYSKSTEHPWLVNKKCPTIVSAGTLSQAKDFITLIKAVENVAKNRMIRLIIFGEGAYRQEYEQYIKDKKLEDIISLPGFTNQLPAEEKVADGFVSSSLLESFGIAIVEALACKIPVIATDSPCGAREILENGRYGKLVRPHNIEDMEKSINKLLDGEIRIAGDYAWKRYSRESIIMLYEKALGLSIEYKGV